MSVTIFQSHRCFGYGLPIPTRTPSEIDGVTYTASMWACVKSEQWEHAVRLFEEQWTVGSDCNNLAAKTIVGYKQRFG